MTRLPVMCFKKFELFNRFFQLVFQCPHSTGLILQPSELPNVFLEDIGFNLESITKYLATFLNTCSFYCDEALSLFSTGTHRTWPHLFIFYIEKSVIVVLGPVFRKLHIYHQKK